MKRFFCWLLTGLLLITSAAFAENVVQLPDQYLTAMVWKSCQVQRQPGTEIVSITEDVDKGIFSTFLGALSFDYAGDYTVDLVEYDTENDITYKTKVHVSVSRRDPTIESRWAKEDNSAKMNKWMQERGYIFAVGQQVSFRIECRIDGVEQKMVYESNNPAVATVNGNGLVTMNSPGRASILIRAEGSDWAESFAVLVHDGEPYTNSWGDFEPEDKTETLNIYKEPSTSSPVIAVKKKWDTDNFYVITRGEEWCKFCYNGIVGYVQTAKLSFYDKFEWDEAEGDTPHFPEGDEASSGETETGNAPKAEQSAAPAGNGSYAKRSTEADGKTALLGGMTVNIERLGLCTSDVLMNGENVTVDSALLTFDENAPAGWNVACIHTPKTGHCNLRKAISEKSAVLKKCKAGTVVAVLKYGSKHCKIDYKGTVGYVKTDCLKPAGTEGYEAAAGVLSYHGKASGSTTVNVRHTPDAGSLKIAEWPTGTDVVILSQFGGWAQVEHGGVCGFVMDEFVTRK